MHLANQIHPTEQHAIEKKKKLTNLQIKKQKSTCIRNKHQNRI